MNEEAEDKRLKGWGLRDDGYGARASDRDVSAGD